LLAVFLLGAFSIMLTLVLAFKERESLGNPAFDANNLIRMGLQKNDLEALKLLKEWSTWLVTIQTATIGGIAVGLKDFKFPADCFVISSISCEFVEKGLATGAIILFGISIVSAMYLLLALPAVAQRLPAEGEGQDIYFMRTSSGHHLPIYFFVRWERWGSISGFACLAVLLITMIWTHRDADLLVRTHGGKADLLVAWSQFNSPSTEGFDPQP
jgi:hypothetical protein